MQITVRPVKEEIDGKDAIARLQFAITTEHQYDQLVFDLSKFLIFIREHPPLGKVSENNATHYAYTFRKPLFEV